MTRWRVVKVRSHEVLGRVELAGGRLVGDPLTVSIVDGVLRRAGGDVAALDGWTNGYVQVEAA